MVLIRKESRGTLFSHLFSQDLRSTYLIYKNKSGNNICDFAATVAPGQEELTHWGRDKITAIWQTTFSNAFSWMKMYECLLRFHWNLFLRFELTIFHHWFRKWLGADHATSQYLNQWWLVNWRIYASLGLNELRGIQSPMLNI